MKVLIMKTSPAYCHLLLLSFKYSPQHPVFKNPDLSSHFSVRRIPIQKASKIIVLFVISL